MITAQDVLVVAAVTGGCALLCAGLGALALRLVRGRSLRVALAVVALTAVAVVASTVAMTSAMMLLTGHAVAVVAAAAVVAAVAAIAVATLLGRALERDSAALTDAVRRLGDGAPPQPAATDGSAELAGIADELARTHARLSASRRREEALESSRRELVAWMSHDLRTPLSGIRAMAEALHDTVVTDRDDVAAYHRQMLLEADRLAGMVNDLFDLSRLHAGSAPLDLREVDLAQLAGSVVAAAQASAARAGVRVAVWLPAGGAVVLADENHLRRAVRNLLDNALRHTPPGGDVTVRVTRVESGVSLDVADACGGIAEQDLSRVFEVGFRGEAARTPGGDHGAGLGLAIARGVAHSLDGEVAVVNRGAGCAFTLTVPSTPVPDGVPDGVSRRTEPTRAS